jgi:phage terminase large subunit
MLERLIDETDATQMPRWSHVLFDDSYRHYAFHGGRGGGKSWAIARFLLISASERSLRIGCGREIQKNLSESVYQLLVDQISALGLEDRFDVIEGAIRGTRNDSLFTFTGLWRNPQGLKSMEGYDYFWGEEAAAFSKTSLKLLVPTLRKENSKFIWSWNPEYPHNAIEKMFRNDEGKPPPPRSVIRKVRWQNNRWFPDVLREEMEAMYRDDPDQAEHVYGGEYIQAVDGAYFAKELRLCREQGRMSSVVIDPDFQIRAFWDLGHSDATAIWIAQFCGERIQIIDYCEGSGQPPGYYMNWLRANGYAKALCVLPHDGSSVHPENPIAMSYEQQLASAGFTVQVVRNQGKGAAQQRIDALRKVFPRIWFNEEATSPGVRALGFYHEKIDEDRKIGLGPEHDWSSHAADAAGLMAITFEPPRKKIEVARKPTPRSKWAL